MAQLVNTIDESKLIHALEELFRSDEYKHLFRQHNIDALHVLTLWISTSILAPMSSWAIVDLLLHPDALVAVKQELSENISSSSTFIYDKEILAKLKILDSCITETYRRVLNSSSMRVALVDTTIECLDNTKKDHSKAMRSIEDKIEYITATKYMRILTKFKLYLILFRAFGKNSHHHQEYYKEKE
ncbi:unnamed protein product [Rotaria magnacalcarata]|uniref:Uncharacterized protein n=1 Tax=Rotaria magnacalcarata TaxID=392030 RepID=A0A819V3L5_9BILA|nr:unnamed protein product [Rotaria magnacalcarata]